MNEIANLRVGVAGWDYADWNGIVYPAGAGSRFDRLAFLARYVDAIEINSTFYRPASVGTAESWARRTADRERFRFTAKSHRSWTHEPSDDPDGDVRKTLVGLEPLREAGKLSAVLVQFPQSFHFRPESLARLERIEDRADGWPLVVEVRHASWETDEARAWFEAHLSGWCAVDQPRIGHSTLGVLPWVSSGVGYLRLHGRNSADWFRPHAGRDARYDYLYSQPELQQTAALVRGMAGQAESMFVIQNNHFRGKALVNALQLRNMLEPDPPWAPDGLIAAYPELGAVTRSSGGRLF